MLKKAKKSRRSQQSKTQNNNQQNHTNDCSPSTSHPMPHLGVTSQSSQQPDEHTPANAESEEMDAFL
jgi:hypothetical protein